MPQESNQNQNETNLTDKVRRTRVRRKKTALPSVVEPEMAVAYGRYHPRPAKSALEAAAMPYEPPYESPALQIGQRAEHPEYDTGHAIARPIDIEDEAA